ncbi:hypothetical protein H0H81_012398 [Sphagnurus paluster]|uniref:Cation/H+ exchanger transmembrane domain-containing protein n=1 Tax=Sphagnurus paluster TaxID=117069 RepID=A0A9P7KK90_9AGAR|nr:hypothetical protein H0H81_012398 [Sphagnurus paluster]
MFSVLIKERLYINELVLGTAFGVLMGPYVLDAFDPRSWGTDTTLITREVTRIVLVTGLFAIGVELPKSYMAKHGKSLILMIVPTMVIGWAIVSGLSTWKFAWVRPLTGRTSAAVWLVSKAVFFLVPRNRSLSHS